MFFSCAYPGVDLKDVLVMCATNCPYAFDIAMRRRFRTKIYVPLPGPDVRSNIFKSVLCKMGDIVNTVTEEQYVKLGQKTEYYSCDDITVVAKKVVEAKPIRVFDKHFSYTAQGRLRPCEGDGLCQDWFVLIHHT